MSTNPEKSAAERARELLKICGDQSRIYSPGSPEEARKIAARWELLALTPQILQDLAAATERATVFEKGCVEFKERAEKAEQDAAECRSLRDVAVQALERRTKEMLAAEERAERAEKELVKALTERARYEAFLSQLQRITAGTMGTQEAIAALQADAERWRDLANQGQWNSDRLQAELAISRAALDRTRQDADAQLAQIPRWRPIESAPKDGIEIVTSSPQGVRVAYWYADNHGQGWYTRGSQFIERTQPPLDAAAPAAEGEVMLYKGHTIKVDSFRNAFVVTVTGPIVPCSRVGTFATKAMAMAYAKERIDSVQGKPEQQP